ncbi:MAG TPA: DNA cytosine methyltransferase [Candidatus Nanoarchaeia archaeon]|nr:DNA cytosine methyltransferase [Candidatus Nanoarchaeia archaeon]
MIKGEQYSVIDLFCGIGGFSKGFENLGFNILLGIDNWEIALKTFEKNHKKTNALHKDLREIKKEEYDKFVGKVDVIIAGPPCQGFSMSGKRNIEDDRNTLFQEVIRCVKYVNPKIVVIENVLGLLSMKNPEGNFVKDIIIQELANLGYQTKFKVLNASDYGVPQARKRIIFIGSKIGNIEFPKLENKKITVGDALGNIPDTFENKYLEPKTKFQKKMALGGIKKIYNHTPMNHNETVKKRITFVPQGGNWKNVPSEYYQVKGEHSNNYRRLDPNKPSITIKHATKSMIIHPIFNRVVTAREVARLQSFGDDFILEGNVSEQQQQLANAVPVLLGEAIAKEIKEALNNER